MRRAVKAWCFVLFGEDSKEKHMNNFMIRVVPIVFLCTLIIGVTFLFAMLRATRVYKCGECGFSFKKKWYQIWAETARYSLRLVCPECDAVTEYRKWNTR